MPCTLVFVIHKDHPHYCLHYMIQITNFIIGRSSLSNAMHINCACRSVLWRSSDLPLWTRQAPHPHKPHLLNESNPHTNPNAHLQSSFHSSLHTVYYSWTTKNMSRSPHPLMKPVSHPCLFRSLNRHTTDAYRHACNQHTHSCTRPCPSSHTHTHTHTTFTYIINRYLLHHVQSTVEQCIRQPNEFFLPWRQHGLQSCRD